MRSLLSPTAWRGWATNSPSSRRHGSRLALHHPPLPLHHVRSQGSPPSLAYLLLSITTATRGSAAPPLPPAPWCSSFSRPPSNQSVPGSPMFSRYFPEECGSGKPPCGRRKLQSARTSPHSPTKGVFDRSATGPAATWQLFRIRQYVQPTFFLGWIGGPLHPDWRPSGGETRYSQVPAPRGIFNASSTSSPAPSSATWSPRTWAYATGTYKIFQSGTTAMSGPASVHVLRGFWTHPYFLSIKSQRPTGRLYVPEGFRPRVLAWAHSSQLACHPGARRTLALLSRRCWWPSVRQDTAEVVSACPVCARAKGGSLRPQGLLQPLSVLHRPWSHVALDFVTGLPESRGNTVILTVVDRFSKYGHFIPLPKLPSAKETAQLLQNIFRIHGLPREVTSDHGPQFTSSFWGAFGKQVGAKPHLSSGFHPQTNGQMERLNQEREKSFCCLVEGKPNSWADSLLWVEYAYNSLPVSSTGLSPFTCCLGYQHPLFSEEEREVEVPAAQLLVKRARQVWKAARRTLLKIVSEMKRFADRRRRPAPRLSMGQKVWLLARDIPLRTTCPKLAPRYIGPFPITRMLTPTAVPWQL